MPQKLCETRGTLAKCTLCVRTPGFGGSACSMGFDHYSEGVCCSPDVAQALQFRVGVLCETLACNCTTYYSGLQCPRHRNDLCCLQELNAVQGVALLSTEASRTCIPCILREAYTLKDHHPWFAWFLAARLRSEDLESSDMTLQAPLHLKHHANGLALQLFSEAATPSS